MEIIATLAAIVAVFAAAVSSRTHLFRGSDLIFQRFSIASGTLFYALCDRSEDTSEKQCSVVREIDAFAVIEENNQTVCGLTLKTDDPSLMIDSELSMVAFGVDKAILVWLEKSKTIGDSESILRMTIIRMSSCKTTEATLNVVDDDDNAGVIDKLDFVTYVDTYVLVAKNLSICSDVSIDGYCRLTYDADGKRIAGPLAWFTPLYEDIVYVVSVAPRSPDKGYLLLNSDHAGYHVYLVRRNGKQVIELGEDPSSDDDYRVTCFSATNGLIGMCYHGDGNDEFTCWQFEQDGAVRAVVDFQGVAMPNRALRSVAMHNLADAGFLLMTLYCTNRTCRGDAEDRYYLTKVDAFGNVKGPREIDAARCDETVSSAWAEFFRNDNDDYCLARLCWNDARLDVNTLCYSDEFFRRTNF